MRKWVSAELSVLLACSRIPGLPAELETLTGEVCLQLSFLPCAYVGNTCHTHFI